MIRFSAPLLLYLSSLLCASDAFVPQRLSLREKGLASTSRASATSRSQLYQAVSTNSGEALGSSTATDAVDYKAYSNGFKTVFEEITARQCLPSLGEIPDDMSPGTYFRVGPAMFSAGSIVPPKTSIIQPRDGPPVPDGQSPKRMVAHPFEGDGGMLAVTFQGKSESEEVTARYRYVRGAAFTNERRKGQRLYKSMDSTREMGPAIGEGLGNDFHTPLFRHHLQTGLNKNRKNTSNTRVIYWGKRLLSLWEGGQPVKMDGLALSTEGRSQLGGILKEQDPFGCKMCFDPDNNRAVFYGVAQDAKRSEVTVYEFDENFRLVGGKGSTVSQDLPGFAMITDMALTERYSIFVQPAVSTSMQFLFVKEPGKVLTVEKAPATLHLVPRLGSKATPKSISIPFDGVVEANMQLINAYEDGNKLIFDAIRSDGSGKPDQAKPLQWPWASTEEEYKNYSAKRSLWRYTVDLAGGSVDKTQLTDAQCFFGTINPKQSTKNHQYVYMALGRAGPDVAPPQGVGRIDCGTGSLDSWMPEAYEFCGEPMFVEKIGSADVDDGYILTVLFNGKEEQSELLILESKNIQKGPITRIPLGQAIPHGLHGTWTSSEQARWNGEEILRRAKLADKMESRGNMWNEVKSDFSGLGLRFDDMEEYFGDSFLS